MRIWFLKNYIKTCYYLQIEFFYEFIGVCVEEPGQIKLLCNLMEYLSNATFKTLYVEIHEKDLHHAYIG